MEKKIFMLYLHIHKAEHYFKRLKYFFIHIIFAQLISTLDPTRITHYSEFRTIRWILQCKKKKKAKTKPPKQTKRALQPPLKT